MLISLANIVLLEVVCETLAAMILMMVNFHYRKVSESHVDESQDSLLKMFLSGLNYIKKDRLLVFAMVMGMSINSSYLLLASEFHIFKSTNSIFQHKPIVFLNQLLDLD